MTKDLMLYKYCGKLQPSK